MHQCKNVNICDFAIFGPIFMKFSLNCTARELKMLFTILRSFCKFLDWEEGLNSTEIHIHSKQQQWWILILFVCSI